MNPANPAGTIAAQNDATARIQGPSSSLAGLRAVVAGLGVSGFPCAVHLAERGAEVIVVDADETRDLTDRISLLEVLGAQVRRGPDTVRALPEFGDAGAPDLLIVSQGWRPDSPLVQEAFARGIPVWGEVELAWHVRGADAAPWLVVTGTNGKTTVTGMLESMVSAAGLRTRACGNIGAPLLEAVLDDSLEVLCIELASFQLHWQRSMSAHAAVCLNLDDDHLDWHGGREGYAEDKARAYEHVQNACVYNRHDEATLRMVEQADVIAGARAIGFSTGAPRVGELGVIEDLLVDRAYLPNRHKAAAELGSLADVALAAGMPGQAPPLHQIANALAAAALARSIGVPAGAVRDGLRAYRPGAHRLETVAEAGGVRWVDDSKATNPHAADASLGSFDSIVWIAGGLAKGARYADLVRRHADRIKAVVLIGADPAPLRDGIAEAGLDVPVARIEHAAGPAVMDAAVQRAAELAAAGDTVLLAPAAASMDQFRDYAQRGDEFHRAVRARQRGGEAHEPHGGG
ncbi:UDP-N-acetylmuramoyl-L-alanine--D-glutamate ligase [Sediminivirga luteola]|uniref:UDP-N-acetylmuramoylalanine--D-glutamate ligase n=1 Tax=Sediminivirga luteola TaxID=1774748 RepID=A0A8J2TZI7_9MICO|nr:UDP-N-acetylmuramoyl-L-alanine--D-glutamate ligase [Sediminivirga luteola]GGA21097.1 UDP-N-acetylmuramoylalanine--D-glutamate ligase [Sediminivirga luteola]